MATGPVLRLTTEVDSTSSQRGLDDFKQKVAATEKASADSFQAVQNKIQGVTNALGEINPFLENKPKR